MNKLKRYLALLLALVLALSLLGCSKSNGPQGNQGGSEPSREDRLKDVEKVKLDHVYSVEYLNSAFSNSENENHNIQQVQEAGGRIYLSASFDRQIPSQQQPGETEYEWGVEVYRLEDDGSLTKLLTFKQESEYDEENSRSTDRYVNNISIAPDGSLWYMLEEYLNDWSDPENYIWESNSCLVHASPEGEELLRIPMADLADPKSEDDYVYIQRLAFPAGGHVLAQTGSGFIGLDTDGKVLFRSEGQGENSWVNSLCATGSGRIIASVYNYSQVDSTSHFTLCEIDPNTGKMTELDDLGSAVNMGNLYGGPGDTLIMGKASGIDSYDLNTHERGEILNWLNCDVNANYVQSVTPLSDGRFFITETNWRASQSTKLAFLRPVGESVEKYVIHFAALYLDDNLTNSIISYNKQNDQFRIVFDDYSQYATDEDYQAGLKVLNQEITSGKIPDIFSMEGLPYDVYASKGLLLDLKPRLEADPDFHMEDYLENVFQAVERDGKICSIIPAFTLQTLVARESWVGKDPGWTMEALRQLMQQHPEAGLFSPEYNRTQVLSTLLEMNMDAFIDPETGACSFNSQDFIQLLELAKAFPEEIDYERLYNDDPMFWEKQQSQYREGRTLLMRSYLSNYNSLRDIYYNFDSDCTFIGFPGAKGSGAIISPNMEIAISGRTKLAEECWDFVRYLLSTDYQAELADTWCFPVRLDALAAMEENALSQENNGGVVYYDNGMGGGMIAETMPAGDAEVYDEAEAPETEAETETGEEPADGETATPGDLEPMPEPIDPGYNDWWSRPLTKEMTDKVTAVVKGARQVYRQQTEIMAIIQEEAGAFFAGQKSAQAVAETIQSRVYLYVMESR